MALPAYTDDLTCGLRAATAAAWLAGHEAPVGHGGGVPLKKDDHVFHAKDIWLVLAPPNAAGQVSLRRVSDNRVRQVAATDCRRLVAPFEFAGLLDDRRAGYRFLNYQAWLEKLLAGTRQAQQVFRLADKDSLPRPHGGHTILLVPTELRYAGFEADVLGKLRGVPTLWRSRRQGSADSWNLPFAPSIHVVSSLTEALEVRRKWAGIKTWNLSVVGKRAVGNSLRVAQLVQAYEQQQWASLTFWGPDLGVGETPGCDVWPWTRTEARGPQAPPDPVQLIAAPLPAPDDGAADLPALVEALRSILMGLSQPASPDVRPVRLPMVWNLLHRCLRFALPPGAESSPSRRYLEELTHTVADCLGEDNDELTDAFIEADRRWPERQAVARQLHAAFTALLTYYQQHSPKHQCLRQLAEEAQDDGRSLLITADRESLAALQSVWQGMPGVTVLPLLGTADNLRRRLLNGALTADDVVAVPFLFNRDQLALLQTAPGPVCLLLLAEVEDGLYERTLLRQQQQEQAQLRASGRAALLGKTYEQLAGPTWSDRSLVGAKPVFSENEQLDYFAELYAVGDTRYATERQRGRASGQLFAFTFTDGYATELDGHTRVLRREPTADAAGQPGWVPVHADQVEVGQEVLFYENDQRQLIEQILRQHDRGGLVQRIDRASRLWQQALRQLAGCYKHTHSLYRALQERGGLDVGLQTLQAYLDGRRRFPGDPTTLPALHTLAEWHELPSCALLAPGAVEEVKHCRGKFQQLAVALGKGLSDDVLRYRLTGTSGPLLNSLDADTREMVLLSAVERTVHQVRRK
ncbi:hypothetical protein MUN84_18680 [Hymenobacter sp. 5516J-16]|uniref:hypothetical protein n=1 Tax=Hymenobacter sp. 5516J-16 TaxID=2932253 RepID=UPI001FD534CE|nr:hypothetical protein [Hymenobacter sp. 5516J-16]UOQ76540.1 hypothetical protein MUN84_18680 [Hymenobacter sp. 5516J-16]